MSKKETGGGGSEGEGERKRGRKGERAEGGGERGTEVD